MAELQYISPGFERIWGRSVESLYTILTEWIDFIVPDDRALVEKAFSALTKDSPSVEIEYRISRPNGDIRWVRVRGFQVRDANSRLVRHAGIVTDITERHQAEAARDRLAEILESTTDIVSMSDPAGQLTYLNGAGRRLLGLNSNADLANTALAEFLPHSASDPLITEGFAEAARSGASRPERRSC